jgi:hypothetical protein
VFHQVLTGAWPVLGTLRQRHLQDKNTFYYDEPVRLSLARERAVHGVAGAELSLLRVLAFG